MAGTGYQGSLGFWGIDNSGAQKDSYWNQDMSDAGQTLFTQPSTGVTAGNLPAKIFGSQEEIQAYARQVRGGFLNSITQALGATDKAISNLPVIGQGYEAVKWPIDKAASGAYWLYSKAVSRPLSALLLETGRAELAKGGFWGSGLDVLGSGQEWSDAWKDAEHTSPAQAFMNYENTAAASGKQTAFGAVAGGADNLSDEQKQMVRQNTDRFTQDSEYWRNKQGWTYTVGTGALDGLISLGADPTYAGVSVAAKAVKGARSIKILDETGKLVDQGRTPSRISGVNMLTDKLGNKLATALAKTPEEASRSKSVNEFFDWAAGKSQPEIAAHPIWGTGRRVNPEREGLSEVLAQSSREEMPLILRYAMKDNSAAAELTQKNETLVAQLGKLEDNRVLLDSTKLDPDMVQHFLGQESKGLGSPAELGTPGVVGTSSPTMGAQLVEPPFPRPTTPGPAQSGWDATYGNLAKQSQAYRQIAGGVLKLQNGVRPMGGAAGTVQGDLMRAEQWKSDQLDIINQQIGGMQTKNQYYADVLGNIDRGVDDFSPGRSNLFGQLGSLYRTGPLALRSSEAAAEAKYGKLTGANTAANPDAGFVSRSLRSGFYNPTVKFINSFSNKVPATMIDHNEDGSYHKIADMLRGVKGLSPEIKSGMLTTYTQAGDKVAKAAVMDAIHADVIQHVASQYNLNYEASRVINQMIKDGQTSTMAKLSGQQPNAQMFSAAEGEGGLRADQIENGTAVIVHPLSKSQLAISQPLLDVNELNRYLQRNSTFINSLMASGASAKDAVASSADNLNSLWKAATLLKPGQVLRSMSDEQVASAVKFGVMSSIIDAGTGGKNFVRNRYNEAGALVGLRNYVPTTGKGAQSNLARIRIEDPDLAQIVQKHGDMQAVRIKPNKALPIAEGRIQFERDFQSDLEKDLAKEQAKDIPDQTYINELQGKLDESKSVVDEFRQYHDYILQHAVESEGHRLGTGTFTYRGQEVPEAFNKSYDAAIPREQVTSHDAFKSMYARSESVDKNRLIASGSWTTVTKDDPHHMDSWLHALNYHFGNDAVFQKAASDVTGDVLRNWLKTPAGKEHMADMGSWNQDRDRFINNVFHTLDQYLPQGTALRDKMANGEKITKADLQASMRPEDFPPVHGEELIPLTRKGKYSATRLTDRILEWGYEKSSTIPNDIMARQPIYLRAQEARMRQFIDQEIGYRKAVGKAEKLSTEDFNNLLAKSDKAARKDISQVVYDPQRTEASEALRFMTPFFSAYQDGLSRWAGLLAESPELIGTASKTYNAPAAANMVTDQQGNPVGEDGKVDIIDPTTGKKIGEKFVPLQDRTLHLRMPTDTQNAKNFGRLDSGVPLSMSSLNTILPGDPWWNPGSGPLVQVAGSQVAKKFPKVGDFMQYTKTLPYGPSQDWYDPLLPKQWKDAWDAYTAGDVGNDNYQQALLMTVQKQNADYANGGPPPNLKKAEHDAKQFMYFDALSSFVSPVNVKRTPLSGTPYQFFADQYKSMQQVDPKNAKLNFYKQYGDSLFSFTASLSKSVGVQATIPAQWAAEKYGKYISVDPSLAGLAVGDVYNQGKFSDSVYRKQMDEYTNGVRLREKVSAVDALKQNQVDLGWQQYGKYSNMIDAQLIRAGFHSYTQSGAEPLQQVRQTVIQTLAEQNPLWYQDFGTTSSTKMPVRIEMMKAMVSDPQLQKDPLRQMDLRPLATYLQLRDQLKAQLAARGGSKLSFAPGVGDTNSPDAQSAVTALGSPYGTNADIGNELRAVQLYLVNNSTAFADVFHRYLENDDLS
jgi:hypothetical protein